MITQNSRRVLSLGLVFSAILMVAGCRGVRSEKPPFHFIINLMFQPKYKAQTLSLMPPEGVVSWGNNSLNTADDSREQAIKQNTVFYYGKTADGKWVSRVPVTVNKAFIHRGQERFNIYCSVCHDRTGSGHGMVVQHGFLPPPVLWDPRVIAYTDGELFNIVSNGIRNMPSYGKQIPEKDRWAIVTYLRAIQKAHTGSLQDVPAGAKLIQPPVDETPKVATKDAKATQPKTKSKTEK